MQCEWLLIFAKNKRAKHLRCARLRRQSIQGELILLNGTLRAALQNFSVYKGREGGERGGRESEGEGEGNRETIWPSPLPRLSLLRKLRHCQLSLSKFLVSTQTVVLRRWESQTWKFGTKRVDKGRITIVRSDRRRASSHEWLTLETQTFHIFHGGISTRLIAFICKT